MSSTQNLPRELQNVSSTHLPWKEAGLRQEQRGRVPNQGHLRETEAVFCNKRRYFCLKPQRPGADPRFSARSIIPPPKKEFRTAERGTPVLQNRPSRPKVVESPIHLLSRQTWALPEPAPGLSSSCSARWQRERPGTTSLARPEQRRLSPPFYSNRLLGISARQPPPLNGIRSSHVNGKKPPPGKIPPFFLWCLGTTPAAGGAHGQAGRGFEQRDVAQTSLPTWRSPGLPSNPNHPTIPRF